MIIPPDTYQQVRDEAIRQPGGVLSRRLMRHNTNPLVGFVHVIARYTVPLAVLASLSVGSLGWATTAAILIALVLVRLWRFVAVPACVAVVVALWLYVRDRIRARRPPVEETQPRNLEPRRTKVPLSYTNQPPPLIWTGATARSMSAGRAFNATDAGSMITHVWRQFAYGFLLPWR